MLPKYTVLSALLASIISPSFGLSPMDDLAIIALVTRRGSAFLLRRALYDPRQQKVLTSLRQALYDHPQGEIFLMSTLEASVSTSGPRTRLLGPLAPSRKPGSRPSHARPTAV